MFPIEYLDLQITLRCNARCANCIKFCNLERVTGLDYSDSDLSLDQVNVVIDDIRAADAQIANLVVTGGEPLLHSDAAEIVAHLQAELVPHYVKRIRLNTNLTLPVPPALQPHVVNYSRPADNPALHDAVFVDPAEPPTFFGCSHYRRWRVVCNYQGYSLCCAGDAYLRLFCLPHLIVDRLPSSYEGFPLADMDQVCCVCPFGGQPLKQAAVGSPVSPTYALQGRINRSGRTIAKRLRSQP